MNFKKRIPFFAVLLTLMLAGNFLSDAASAQNVPAVILILALQTALFGLMMWLGFFADGEEREKLEGDRTYLILNFLSIGMVTLAYFVFEGWVVLSRLDPAMQL